jgi:hypothetical protein
MMYDTDKILSKREFYAMKEILAVSRDSELCKIITSRLLEHEEQVLIRDTYRRTMKMRRKIIGR